MSTSVYRREEKEERYARPTKINDLITPTIASHGRPAKVPSLSASDVNINGDVYKEGDRGVALSPRSI